MKQGVSTMLWANVDDNSKIITRCRAQLSSQQQDPAPCDGETLAICTAVKNPAFKSCILASNKKTSFS